jgi:flagellar basal body rod protein FlgF
MAAPESDDRPIRLPRIATVGGGTLASAILLMQMVVAFRPTLASTPGFADSIDTIRAVTERNAQDIARLTLLVDQLRVDLAGVVGHLREK